MSKQDQTTPVVKPVDVSGDARRALTDKMRQWSGWPDARVTFGKPPRTSPWAATDMDSHAFIINTDELVLNPNRVLLTVTPFRLRQEAVLTGAMLHEAGHARYSHWLDHEPRHSDGSEPTPQTIAVARMLEEPRVEGRVAAEATRIGAGGLDWTMRASAAALLPTTRLTIEDPGQQIMDVLDSWVKRAGRQVALYHRIGHTLPRWVADFTAVVHAAIVAYRDANGSDDGHHDAVQVFRLLSEMIQCDDDRGSTMLDLSRDLLAILFPETDGGEDSPMPGGGGCGMSSEQTGESEGESDEDGEQGEGNTEPEDEGSGDDPGAGDSGDDEDGEPEDDGASDSTSEDTEPEGDEPDEGEGEGDAEGDEPEESEADAAQAEASAALAKALADLEAQASASTEAEAEEEAEATPPPPMEDDSSAGGSGVGEAGGEQGKWRQPTSAERDVQKGAERFLRDMIEPTETSKVSLSESPSATVDGAALAAWKAGGQQRDPMFFKRTRRMVEPSAPVKIAVLVDVSGSMEDLQAPSALLSWALTNAALDLRNFAGRGQQVESTLIHWGDSARVIQRNGQILPGIREYPCWEGTSAMHEAMALVEQQIPGFFDVSDKPVHRLLVQFTDWDLGWSAREATPWIKRSMEAGVNMLSVVPRNYTNHWSKLPDIMRACPIQRGKSSLLKYNTAAPGTVWDEAAKALA